MKHLVIGIGSIGKRHYNLLKEAGEEVIGIDKGDTYDIDKFDWIWICTPSDIHHKFVIEGLNKGKTVICEKPLSDEINKVKEIEKAWEKNKKLWVCCNMRFHPAIQILKEALPQVGKVLYSCMHFSHFLPYQRENLWIYVKTTDIFMDVGWHYVDLAQWLFGNILGEEHSLYWNKIELGIIDYTTFHLKHEKCDSYIHLDYLRRDKSWGIEIVGTKGTLTLESHFKNTEVISVRYYTREEMIELEHRRFHSDEMYRNQLNYLLSNKWKSNIDEAVEVMKICQ